MFSTQLSKLSLKCMNTAMAASVNKDNLACRMCFSQVLEHRYLGCDADPRANQHDGGVAIFMQEIIAHWWRDINPSACRPFPCARLTEIRKLSFPGAADRLY